jgi:hypothetical protein
MKKVEMNNPTPNRREIKMIKKVDLDKLQDYVTKYVEQQLILNPDTVVIHECPNCHTRYPLNNVKPMFETNIVNFIMDWAKKSELYREQLWLALVAVGQAARDEDELNEV